MARLIRRTALGTLIAATLVMGAPQAFAVSDGGAAGQRLPGASTARAGALPEGFTREGLFGPAGSCDLAGRSGVAEGRWREYLCIRDLPFTPYLHLYVKKW
ncbi:hypothetical protein [Streptomyces wuyuanensis]|uniref:hypothetical protein n=1 Tax=Streptomyces wuyuanensis TaxID=1196353 RepID=UPI003791D406